MKIFLLPGVLDAIALCAVWFVVGMLTEFASQSLRRLVDSKKTRVAWRCMDVSAHR